MSILYQIFAIVFYQSIYETIIISEKVCLWSNRRRERRYVIRTLMFAIRAHIISPLAFKHNQCVLSAFIRISHARDSSFANNKKGKKKHLLILHASLYPRNPVQHALTHGNTIATIIFYHQSYHLFCLHQIVIYFVTRIVLYGADI